MAIALDGKVAVVTGGTSGIGRDTSVLLAKAGAKVVVAGRREAEGEETVAKIRAEGADAVFVKTDVSKASDVQALVEKAVAQFGHLDIAFNNAGIEGPFSPIIPQSEEDLIRPSASISKEFGCRLKYEIRQMLKQGNGGAIVNMASVLG